MIDLYKNIKKRRLELEMSQQTLAEKVGYTGKSMISKVERGEVDLSETMIKKFASALNISPSDLMGWDNIDWNPDTQEVYESENSYYIEGEAKEYAEFLAKNPEYKVLFDASRKVKPEDMQKALKAIGLFIDEE